MIKYIECKPYSGGLTKLTIVADGDRAEYMALAQDASEKPYEVVLKPVSRKRSKSQFSMAWARINEIANITRSSKVSVYHEALRQYGQGAMLPYESGEDIEKLLKVFTLVEPMGNGYAKCYPGISDFDSRELSIFTDGLIAELKELKDGRPLQDGVIERLTERM